MRWITGIAILGLFGSVMLSGCNWDTADAANLEAANGTPTDSGQAYLGKTAIRDETGAQADNAVDAAMEWSRKYADASARRDQLLQENRQLRQTQQTFQQQITKLQFELSLAEKELDQANSMLLEMKTELEKWKTSVLGFRDEMRQSQKTQLDALVKILALIGGEVVEPPPAATQPTSPQSQPAEQIPSPSQDKEKTGGA